LVFYVQVYKVKEYAMISSMTAFARLEHRDDLGGLVWELRSVNHRYLEMSLRLPEELRAIEPSVRELVTQKLGRGKVDCNLRFEPGSNSTSGLKVNERLALQIIEAAKEVGHLQHEAVPPRTIDIMRWPGVLEAEKQDFTPLQQRAQELLTEALDSMLENRQREGARLAELIQQRCTSLQQQVGKVRERMPIVLDGIRERLHTKLDELSENLDEGRLEQEMTILCQRLDVDEEMDRLDAHLKEVAQVLERDEPVGRRLDFLMQELNREANTLSSKSNDAETTKIAVEMKVLIEQMREQVQNIE
jgi:uncharacterized protein (TIGR00255 family)